MPDLIPPTNPPAPQPYRPVPVAPVKPVEKSKVPLSLSMSSADYCARLTEEREKATAAEEKEMLERHAEEKKYLESKQAAELQAVKDEREETKAQMAAVGKYVDMWKRQAEESKYGDRDDLRKKHEAESVNLARKTGYEIRKPTVGDTTLAGFPSRDVVGHPWIRAVDTPLSSRLHPEI